MKLCNWGRSLSLYCYRHINHMFKMLMFRALRQFLKPSKQLILVFASHDKNINHMINVFNFIVLEQFLKRFNK